MKRSAALILILTLILGLPVYADENTLTVDDVFKTAVQASKTLTLDDYDIENSQKVYDNAVSESNNIAMSVIEASKWFVGDADKDPATVTQKRKDKEYTPDLRKYELELSRKTRILDEAKLKLDVYTTYYSLIKANKEINLKQSALDLAKAKLNDASLKYKKGMISKNDYTFAELAKKDSEVQLNLANREQKRLLSKFYRLMGDGYKPDVKTLDETYEVKDLGTLKVEDAINSAMRNRIEIYKADQTADLKQKEFDITDRYYGEGDVAYKEAYNNLEEAKFNKDNASQDVEYEIRYAYNNIQNMLDTIEVNKRDVLKAKIHYTVAELKQKLGMAVKLDVQEAKFNLDNANNILEDSIYDYLVTRMNFDLAQDLGPGVSVQ